MQSTEQLNSTKQDSIIKKIDEVDEKLTTNSLAWEMLKDQRQTIKKLFAVIFVLVILWFSTVVGFGICLSQYDTVDSIEQSVEADQDGDNNIVNGGDIYGTSEG